MNVERRHHDRLSLSVEVVLRRRGTDGARHTVPAVLDNVSSGGAFVRVADPIAPGEPVLLVFRLSKTGRSGPHVAARGRVLRAAGGESGATGIALRFTHHRFL